MASLSSQTPFSVFTPGGISSPKNAAAGNASPTKSVGADFFPVASGIQVPYVGRDAFGLRPADFDTTFKSEELPAHLAYGTTLTTGHVPGFTTQTLNTANHISKNESLGKVAEVFAQLPNGKYDKSCKTVSKTYLKKITCGLSFSEDVVESWAPFAKPYNASNPEGVYKRSGISHHKKKSIGLVGRHDPPGSVRRHGPCYLNSPRKLKPLKRNTSVLKKTPVELSLNKLKVSQDIQEHDRPASRVVSKYQWDEHLLSSISKSTAEWIVSDHMVGPEKERLSNFLNKLNTRTLDKELPDKKSGDKTLSSIPNEDKIKKGKASGKQAVDVHYSPSFAFSKKVGDKKLSTDNLYQQELLGGAQPVPSKKTDPNVIILDSNEKIKFQKQLQENFPQEANFWFEKQNKGKTNASKVATEQKKLVKGATRWSQLPVIVQDDDYTPQQKETKFDVATLSEEYKLKKKMTEDINIVKIADEWRSKWFLENKWQKSTTEELIQAMNNINDHVRLAAVSACSKAAEIRQADKEQQQLGIILEKTKDEELNLGSQLEPELIEAIRKLLDDVNTQVRIASAITLYTLNKQNEKATTVLEWTMENGGVPEKWAATQCLAMSGVISDKIVFELVHQLHADNAVRSEQASTLLARLSQHSGIVQAMIAELLNSNSWRDRLRGCQVIPKLKCGTNRDMAQKLSYLMWNDWSKEVRIAAAQALGKTGNGKVVHDALKDRIMTGNERDQLDALKKVSSLGIMTARLLPALLFCFKSGYVSVRIEATKAAGNLQVSDEKVIDTLLGLASADPSWKVKAHAIQALASIGVVNEKLHDVLLWAIRYEKLAAVRAEACSAVAALGITDKKLVSVLQDRIMVETDEFVKSEAIWALQQLGVEPTGDVEMLQAIRREVQARCTRDAIVAHILHEDRKVEDKQDYQRFLTTDDEESRTGTAPSGKREKSLRSRATSEGSSRGWDPILAAYHAREIFSRVVTPRHLRMERSILPMDLNSASSENSSVIGSEDWDKFSDSEESRNAAAATETDQQEEKASMEEETENSLRQSTSRRLESNSSVQHSGEQIEHEDTSVHPQLEKYETAVSTVGSDRDSFISDHESNKDDPELMALADDETDQPTETEGNTL